MLVAAQSDLEAMARSRFGYGRWDAPYWFIGPEEGDAPESTIKQRLGAWIALGGRELDDCLDFHADIEPKWHRVNPPAPLQPTWRRLILLLRTVLGQCSGKESLRDYQRAAWGMHAGETCVIELSGIPAHSYEHSKTLREFYIDAEVWRDIRKERIRFISDKINIYNPKLVVMYGCSEQRHWESISGVRFSACQKGELGQIHLARGTIFAFVRHPVAHGYSDQQWIEFGVALRKEK